MTGKVIAALSVQAKRTTVIQFPAKPSKTKPGSNDFHFEYIKNDLAITPLKIPARTNVFVYVEGKRYGFDLSTVWSSRCDIYEVNPVGEELIKVDWYDE
jgi:hypothetical protein